MKLKIIKCKVCGNKMQLFNSLRPYCGFECGAKYAIRLQENKKAKEDKDKFKAMKISAYSSKNKKSLQDEVNKLARMIDEKFGYTDCIDCGKFMDKGRIQIDACHLHSRGKNGTLKYNLNNLHSGHNHCNVHNRSHESNYKLGIEKRYGRDYLHYIEIKLPLIYKEIHLTEQDYSYKLKIVRKLIRDFNTFRLGSSLQARKLFNDIIGIYK